jgi:hypothetical protein
MDQVNQQVEHVARAFYEAQEAAQSWNRVPDLLKDEFRLHARQAIALLKVQEEGLSKDRVRHHCDLFPGLDSRHYN